MQVVNLLEPDTSQMPTLKNISDNEPIYLVNLLKFRKIAQYTDNSKSKISGKTAYQHYMRTVEKILPTFGGKVIFAGDVTGMWLGQVEELWDEVIVVKYPSRKQMLAMGGSAEWQAASIHRSAGLEGQLNIETVSPIVF